MSNNGSKIKAPVNFKEDLGTVLGTSSGDLDYNVLYGRINKNALFKPVDHPNIGYILKQDRIVKFHGLVPKDLASIRGTSTFSTIPTPEEWGYVRPPVRHRSFDFTKILTDLSVYKTDWGYNALAEAPMKMSANVTVRIATTADGGDVLCPTFRYDDSSTNAYGSADIEIVLKDVIFRYYGERDNVAAWKLPSSYDDIFNAAGALTTGVWRFAIALAVKTGTDGPYRWLIVSSVRPLAVPFIDSNFSTTVYEKFINPSACQTVANIIKYAARNYGQSVFRAIPFLACSLQYFADGSTNPGWRFTGSNYDRAITFPDGDAFDLTVTGFVMNIIMQYVSFRVAYTSSNDQTQDIRNLTWYTATTTVSAGVPFVNLSLPRPTASYMIAELTFKLSSSFGTISNMVAGIMRGTSSAAGQLYTNDNVAIDNISGEWEGSERTYKVRCMAPELRTIMDQSPDSTFPQQSATGFEVSFDDTGLAARQKRLEAGFRLSLIQ